MYKIVVPVYTQLFTEENKFDYLNSLKRAEAERVFLIVDIFKDFSTKEIKEKADFLRENGIEPAIWVGNTIGHGGYNTTETQNDKGWTYMRSLKGDNVENTYCPFNESFVDYVSSRIAELAKVGVNKIQIDDDFRLAQHGNDICCLCDLHLAKISEILGEKVDLNVIREKAFKGGKNKYRTAFLKAQGDSLKFMAQKIRDAVNTVDKTVNLSFCTAWSVWDVDGTTPIELVKILAGDNKPFLRLHPAPYQVAGYKRITSVIEMAKNFASFFENEGIEIVSEGDCYPRPRYKIAASYVELFDIALRADGAFDGIQKYMYDYISSLHYEDGYVERHVEGLETAKKVTNAFSGADFDGVRVYSFPQTFENRDVLEDYDTRLLDESPFTAGDIFAGCGIPTTYYGEGICPAVFGENVKYVSDEVLSKGAILDAVSAKILFEKGVDVGFNKINSFKKVIIKTETFNGDQVNIVDACRYLDVDYNTGAIFDSFTNVESNEITILATIFDGVNDKVLSYRYQNKNGQKFLVLNFSLEELICKSNLKYSYYRQKQLIDAIEWISGRKLPAKTFKNPETYIITKRKGDKLLVMVLNLFPDHITNLKIYLDKEYKKLNVIEGDLSLNGDIVTVNGKFSAFSYVAFEVE